MSRIVTLRKILGSRPGRFGVTLRPGRDPNIFEAYYLKNRVRQTVASN